jgi:hypothetical protein
MVKIRKKSVLLSECPVSELAGWYKITRLFNFSFCGARESLRLFELKTMCGGEMLKHSRTPLKKTICE